MRTITMIADCFDSRTLARMEVALDLACKVLAFAGEQHPARRYQDQGFHGGPITTCRAKCSRLSNPSC